MTLTYSELYWNNYYGGRYEDTYMAALGRLKLLLKEGQYHSFCDVGCGPGQTLELAKGLLPDNSFVYGIECQAIPSERVVKGMRVINADFLEVSDTLPAVDFLFVTCSMYILPAKQAQFLLSCLSLCKKTIAFANVYKEDAPFIPVDKLRVAIYESRSSFRKLIEQMDHRFSYDESVTEYAVFNLKG